MIILSGGEDVVKLVPMYSWDSISWYNPFESNEIICIKNHIKANSFNIEFPFWPLILKKIRN